MLPAQQRIHGLFQILLCSMESRQFADDPFHEGVRTRGSTGYQDIDWVF